MMRKRYSIILLCAAVMFVACKKPPIEPLGEGNSPIYTLNALIDEEEVELNVGLEAVTMNHGLSNKNGILTYYGEIESVLKDEKIRIDIIRHELPNRPGERTKVFNSYSIPYLVHEPALIRFDFGGVGNEEQYVEIPDESGIFYSQTNELMLEEFGVLPVNLRFNRPDTPIEDVSFNVKYGFRDSDLNSAFEAKGNDESGILVIDSEEDFAQHQWFVDGVLVGEESTYEGEISDQVHHIRHVVRDTYGNSSESENLVRFKEGKHFWNMNINYDPHFDFNDHNYGRVIVSMYKNGEWFRSDNTMTNEAMNFEVDSLAYIPAEFDDQIPLLAFKYNFDAVLHNENKSDSLVLSNANGTFSVGLE